MPVREGKSVRTATAFAPGHVTGIFSPAIRGKDPRSRGSLGVGIVLELGVRARATWRPGPRRRIDVTSPEKRELPISREVAEHLVGARTGSLHVHLIHELPIGCGLGMSAAGALATALAVSAVVGEARRHAIEIAHLADLFGGGGLGGVSAILGGGLEHRISAGVPPWGRAIHSPYPRPLMIIRDGRELPSLPWLTRADFLHRVEVSARGPLARFSADPTIERFWGESETFTRSLRLDRTYRSPLLRELRSAGIPAAQAMLGRTLFADTSDPTHRTQLRRILERRGNHAVEMQASRRGAIRIASTAISPAQGL